MDSPHVSNQPYQEMININNLFDLPKLNIQKDGTIIFDSYLDFIHTTFLYVIKIFDELLDQKGDD